MATQTKEGNPLFCPRMIDACGQETCAWWIISAKKCCVPLIAEDLHQALQMGNLLKTLAVQPDLLRKLAGKMPKGGERK